jgi:replicative DNA helicase
VRIVTPAKRDPAGGPLPDHLRADEAEQRVLGLMLRSAGNVDRAMATLAEADFYQATNRTVWRQLVALRVTGQPVSVSAVQAELRAQGQLDSSLAAYLVDLHGGDAVDAELDYFAGQVARAARGRRRRDAVHEYLAQTADPDVDQDAAAARAAARLTDTSTGGLTLDQRRLVAGGTFILDAPKQVPAVWGDHDGQVAWSQDEPLLIGGPSGVGKTTLAQQLIRGRLGLLPAVLGLPVVPGDRRVLYLACDRPAQAQRSFARMVSEADREVLDRRLVVWRGPPPADLARHPETLLRMCQAADADTVIIDSLKDVALKLTDDEVGQGLNACFQRVTVEGIQLLGLHHQRKSGAGGGKPKSLEDVYGSVWLTAGAGSVLLLWGEAGDPVVELLHLKQPADPVGPFKVVHDHDRGISDIFERKDVLVLLRHWKAGMSAADLAGLLTDGGRTPTDSDRERARRKLDKLVHAGLATCKPGVRGGQGVSRTPTLYFAAAPDSLREGP